MRARLGYERVPEYAKHLHGLSSATGAARQALHGDTRVEAYRARGITPGVIRLIASWSGRQGRARRSNAREPMCMNAGEFCPVGLR